MNNRLASNFALKAIWGQRLVGNKGRSLKLKTMR